MVSIMTVPIVRTVGELTSAWLAAAPAVRDAAYFLGSSLSVEDRRAHEEPLLRLYHDELLAQGVQGFSWEQCREEYRRQTFWAILMVIVASMLVERTDRGDEMFMAWLARSAQQVVDQGALSLRFDAPGGRVSFFPRAMCRVQTTDGRTGLGWLEWNRLVQSQPTTPTEKEAVR